MSEELPPPPPLSDLRKSYEQGTLEEHQVASEPLRQFQDWLAEALRIGIHERRTR